MRTDPASGFNARPVHQGRGFGGTSGAVMQPVFLTSTFESGNPDGFDVGIEDVEDLREDLDAAFKEVLA